MEENKIILEEYTSVHDFAKLVAKMLIEEYSTLCYEPFVNTLLEELKKEEGA